MFQECVRHTPLTGGMADQVFQNINGYTYRDDETFVATLRMLLHGKMKDDDRVFLYTHRCDRNPARYRDGSAKEDIESALGIEVLDLTPGDLMIAYIDVYGQEDRDTIMNFIDKHFTKEFTGWTKMQKVTDLFRKKPHVLCFNNVENRSTIVFVERMDFRVWHFLQISIAGLLPWFFSEKPSNVDEIMELMYSLRESTSEKYMQVLCKFAEQFDFRSQEIKNLLHGFEDNVLRARKDSTERRINEILRNIADYDQAITNLIREKYDLDITYTGLMAKLLDEEKDDEFMEYFLANKSIVLEEVTGGTVKFGVKGYLEFVDEDALKGLLKNSRSFIYTTQRGKITKEQMKSLMTAIFIDNKLKLRTCGVYWIDLRGGCEGISGFNYGAEYDGYMPNTHIDRFHCIGNYRQAIRQCLERHDYIMAVEQCAASVRSLNFNDSPVMERFMNEMYNYTRDTGCIETPDGQILKPEEAIEWLNAHKEG